MPGSSYVGFVGSESPADTMQKVLGWPGRMISGSKSFYSAAHPKNVVVFNANLCTKTHGKIWYGDIDVTRDGEKLKEAAKLLGEDVYVLYEMDGRFENEQAPILERARAIVSPTEIKVQERKY